MTGAEIKVAEGDESRLSKHVDLDAAITTLGKAVDRFRDLKKDLTGDQEGGDKKDPEAKLPTPIFSIVLKDAPKRIHAEISRLESLLKELREILF